MAKKAISWLTGYIIPTAAVGLFLWLWFKSGEIDLHQHSRYLNNLQRMQELDARINQNILQARQGILTYYDPIVSDLHQLKKIQADLKQTPSFVAATERHKLIALIQDSEPIWQAKAKSIERFESQNAILKNSLAYLPIAIADLVEKKTIEPTLANRLNTLLQKILLLNLSPSDRSLVPEIARQMQQILTIASSKTENDQLKNAIAHAEIILKTLPQLEELVDRLMKLPISDRAQTLLQAYDLSYQQALITANWYRFWLYLLSTVLVIGVATSIILKLRASEMAIRRSETKFRHIFENSQVGIFRVGIEDGSILDLNQRCAEMFGYDSPADVIGQKRTIDLYADPSDRQRVLAILQTHQEIHNFETQFQRRDRSLFWGLFSGQLHLSENCVEGVIADISEQQAALRERRAAEAALQQALAAAEVANSTKSQFLSHMSHELRTPLNVILGFSQLMGRTGSLNTQQQEYLQAIARSGEHLLGLINDVLEMSKIEAGKITLNEQSFDLYAMLDGLHQMLAVKAESKGLQLTFTRDSDLPQYIRTDESKLRQVLLNLLGNAIKFTASGCVTLRVQLGCREAETRGRGDMEIPRHEDKAIDSSPSSPSLSFQVEDTGVGIAAEELDRIFEPFVQAEVGRNLQGGTGLGLAISRKFVQLMGGEIEVESKLAAGTIFRFQIQVRAATAEEIPAPSSDRQVVGLEVGQPNYRILVVEDKLENRQLLVDLLQPLGFAVQVATNGEEAIAAYQTWLPHLIWMDLRLPILDGYAATREIRVLEGERAGENYTLFTPHGKTAIVALTGSVFEEDRAAAIAVGCDDFVRKPFRAETILEKMSQYLGVRYLYGRDRELATTTRSPLTPADLAAMPADWIEQVHQAAIRVNAKEILNLITQIPQSHIQLANALTDLSDRCAFEEIVSLTQVAIEQTKAADDSSL
jgi:PAS domain S-box-containing protein